MSLLVIYFTYLDGRDGEIVVKDLAAVDSTCNRVSSYIFKRPYTWDEVPVFNARLIMLSIVVATGMTATYCIQLETVLRREASSAVAIYCFGPQKSAFISNLIYRIVIDITQLRCPQLADKSFYHQLHVCTSQHV